jgi:hypothetical protein
MLRVSARPARHPVYRHRAIFWGEVHDPDGKLRYGIGPYRARKDAIHAAHMWSLQHGLPGIEAPDVAVKQTLADPLPPQKPCDHGLFSDAPAQLDLIDMARKG